MGNYVANMDLQIGNKLFQHLDPITVNLRQQDVDFLLKMGMISEQADQKPAEPEKKNRKQKEKSGNAEDQKTAAIEKQDAK